MTAAPPLTHHEILGLVEPFTRRGRRVDLAATNRLERRLVFKPIAHAATGPTAPEVRERLQLESFSTGTFRLTRELALGDGPRATLQAVGPDPGALLAEVSAVPVEHHFRSGDGYVIARSYALPPVAGDARPADAVARAMLVAGEVRVAGLTLAITVSPVKGMSGDITLSPAPGTVLDLPDDLLAVLGWDWARLIANRDGWKSKLRLRGDVVKRSRMAERALDRVATHLAETIRGTPSGYHDRWVRARWGVVVRRAIPVLTLVTLLVAISAIPRLFVERKPGVWLLMFHVPALLIAISFCMQELPVYEIPPWPRRRAGGTWGRGLPVGGGM